MAKKKNSGFSLIEVVIAVAILGLLITPILTQIVQTSNTSRKAKERQAAVENAEMSRISFKEPIKQNWIHPVLPV